jgi:DNA polymerase III subunit delta'
MEGVLGQERALEVLQAALASGRLHHAYIFHGPAGVGKFTTALALAKVLLCHDRQTGLTGAVEACGVCPSCKLLRHPSASAAPSPDAAAHPDLRVVTKELARFSDDPQVRERKLMNIPTGVIEQYLLEPVYRSAQLRHGKVFIVDEAELMDPIAQNKLLKTLEEPPPGTTIILVTAQDSRLLMTIRSRGQRVAFVPLATSVLDAWMERHHPALTPDQRTRLTAFASGSLGRLQLALDYKLPAWQTAVLPAIDDLAKGRFDASLAARIRELIDDFAAAWVDRHENASKDAANKMGAGLMWSMIAEHARQRLGAALPLGAPADPSATDAAARPWLAVLDLLAGAERAIAANVNQGLVCDHLVMTMYRALA